MRSCGPMFLCLGLSLFSKSHGFQAKSICRVRPRETITMRWGLKTNAQPNNANNFIPFEVRGFSLPLVVFSAGIALTASSFVGFFSNQDGSEGGAISSLGFVYGIPIFLIGLSLWYAEIPPVPVFSDATGDQAWQTYQTPTLAKIKQDVTRHRYGDYAHLDSTLTALGLKLPQKRFPKLLSLRQGADNSTGQLVFTLEFESLETPYKLWADPDRIRKYEKFFGPGVSAAVRKVDAEKKIVALVLTTLAANNSELPRVGVWAEAKGEETLSGQSVGDV